MKANELRIGNFVKGVRIGKVKSIFNTHFQVDDEKCISLGNSLQQIFHPIQLTEEWLLNFGFEKYKLSKEVNQIWRKKRQYGFFDLEQILSFYLVSSEYCMKCNYVHQLQNLYFAITGQELEIIS